MHEANKTFILLNKKSILSNNSKKSGDIDFIDKKKIKK